MMSPNIDPSSLPLRWLDETYAVCRLVPKASIPPWAAGQFAFSSITCTKDECSIVVPESAVPPGVQAERGWRAFRVEGTLDFGTIGVIAYLSQKLKDAHISVFVISTFDTDYVLVPANRRQEAERVLSGISQPDSQRL